MTWEQGAPGPAAPRLFVTVGTDHHPFSRLVEWVDRWAQEHPEVELVAQHGAAPPPRRGTSHRLLGMTELADQYAAATLVVSQVGPGSIADANRAGHRPVVVPRDPELHEVVDDHQVAFGALMTEHGRCDSVRTYDDLAEQLERRLADPAAARVSPEARATSSAPGVVADLARTALDTPRRHFSLRRLLTAVRRPARGSHRGGS